jgi:hypothetical protein
VTVIHPVPTVAITADPSAIEPGGSSILQWTTTDADSVSIDQGIGEQPANGQVTVMPSATTTYTITATGPGGSATGPVTVTVSEPSPITLMITSPETGITVHTQEIMIVGTVVNQTGKETGIIVNGITAQVNGNQFFANSVQLREGENAITVSALDTDENYATITMTVTLDTSTQTNWIGLQVNPASGVAPMTTTLSFEYHMSFTPIGRPQIRYEGPDNVELTWATDAELTMAFQTPGIYTFYCELTDPRGNMVQGKTLVNVLDRANLDAMLQTKWDDMKEAMLGGDIEGAIKYCAVGRKDSYRRVFTTLAGQLGDIISGLGDVELLEATDSKVKYGLEYEVNINGVPTPAGSYLIFIVDVDGLWKIEFF